MVTTQKAKSIAVALDGSAPGWEAFSRALNMARLLSLPLDVLYVIQLRKAGYFAFIDRHLMEDEEAYAKQVCKEAHDRAQTKGVEVTTQILENEKDPSMAIVEFLEAARGVKFLVIGSYGHGFKNRAILGSTTERVIREIARRGIPVPVLVVPASSSLPEED